MQTWEQVDLDRVVDEIQGGHQHVAFLIGSVVSMGEQSGCLSVRQVEQAVLKALLPSVKADAKLFHEISEYLDDRDHCHNEVGSALRDVPFEQLLACLYSTSREASEKTVNLAFGGPSRRPNDNHLGVAEAVSYLLENSADTRVSILTTNYDTCVETALRQRANLELERVELPVPAFQARGRPCRYVKLHGCVEEPTSMIFTIDQMGRLMAAPDWVESVRDWLCDAEYGTVDLAVSLGYGFKDPDLYPIFRECLAPNSIFIRNEKSDFRGAESLSGRAVLQSDFFQELNGRENPRCTRLLVKSDLIRPEGGKPCESLLVHLHEKVRGNSRGLAVPKAPSPQRLEDKAREIADVITTHVGGRQLVFWARLLHAANRPDGTTLFRNEYERKNSDPYVARNMAKAYLYSFTTGGDNPGASRACDELAALDRRPDIQAFVLAFWSLTERDPDQASAAWSHLRSAKKMIGACGDDTRVFIRHCHRHFKVKGIEKVWQMSRGLLRPRRWARRLATAGRRDYEAIEKSLGDRPQDEGGDLVGKAEMIGDIMTLCAEADIISGDLEQAEEQAKKAYSWRSYIGRVSNALQADRLLGWCHLASGTSSGRAKAIECFARGYARALNVPSEPGLRKKVGANLLRAIWAGKSSDLRPCKPVKIDFDEVESACRQLRAFLSTVNDDTKMPDGLFRTPDSKACIDVITQSTLHVLDTNRDRIINEITMLANLKRCPIYLPSGL